MGERDDDADKAANTNNKAGGGGLLDRSKVRILICDSDPNSSQHVLQLLRNCSYQVTSVKSARQVIEVLNSEGSEIDIILAEVDLPLAKGFKLLKYIDLRLKRIPIIMMSSQDSVSVVVKCLRLGAADYLVKPLRTNELLNLWTHMWRRRRMLGLPDKHIFSENHHEIFDEEPSEENTTALLLSSDDTGATVDRVDKDKDDVVSSSKLSAPHSDYKIDDPSLLFSGKTNLKVGESSAFLAYVRSPRATINDHIPSAQNAFLSSQPSYEDPHNDQNTPTTPTNVIIITNNNNNNINMTQHESSSSSSSVYHHHQRLPMYHQYPAHLLGHQHHEGINVNMNVMPPHSMQIFQGLHQYNNMFQYNPHHVHMMVPPPPHYNNSPNMNNNNNMWSPCSVPAGNNEPSASANSQTERRAAALVKFRRKRKERCFDKKIRYINRKKLAETRPRVRGQFVRQGSESMDFNFSVSDDLNYYDEEEAEEVHGEDEEE
ncbi:hypothetical protein LUZ60_005574 [Juncus effusus]|nr:hypothetical protein LUZ60_005574 [Juncus effusus]